MTFGKSLLNLTLNPITQKTFDLGLFEITSSGSISSCSKPNDRKSFRIFGMSSKLNPSAANRFSTFGIEVVVGRYGGGVGRATLGAGV